MKTLVSPNDIKFRSFEKSIFMMLNTPCTVLVHLITPTCKIHSVNIITILYVSVLSWDKAMTIHLKNGPRTPRALRSRWRSRMKN